jgi:hypothetical protein
MSAKTLFEGGNSGLLYTDRRQFYFDPMYVAEDWTDASPFCKLLSYKESKIVTDPLYKQFEHRVKWRRQWFQVTSTATLTANDSESSAITIKDGTTKGLAGETANVATNAYVGLELESQLRRYEIVLNEARVEVEALEQYIKGLEDSLNADAPY